MSKPKIHGAGQLWDFLMAGKHIIARNDAPS
jgi:hypothetical protein